MKLLFNVALFQIGWFASVLGAAHDRPYLGPLIVGVALAVHLRFFATKREGFLILASALLGAVAESAIGLTGVIAYRADPPPSWLCPPWIVAMWTNFSLTLRHSLRWLERRFVLAAIAGAVGGPLAYLTGRRLGAIELIEPVAAILLLAALWRIALLLLFAMSRHLKKNQA
ncbi:MAG TPA: DUF2878 domain-containing protein [Vicinamibacteria bacterium]|nr:DUF2878 domain-containing protein [Vicinamibacteria bacterium]